MRPGCLVVLVCGGCTQLFGLDSPTRAGTTDASPGDGTTMDVSLDGAAGPQTRRLVVAADKVTGGPHASFPVLVQITAAWLRPTTDGGDVASEDGVDIYFSSDEAGLQRLAHETDRYDALGAYTGWVRIPSLTASTSFYLHYGDSTITDSQEDEAAVWSNNYALVAHMFASTMDSTGVSTLSGVNVSPGTGIFGGALAFNGADSYINAGSLDAIDGAFNSGGTIEAWIRPTGFGESGYGRVADKGRDSGWILYVNNVNNASSFSFAHGSNSTTFGQWTSPVGSIALNTWQHVAAVFDRSDGNNIPTLYLNGSPTSGELHSTPSGAFDNDATHTMFIGNNETGDRTFDGQIDEVRLSGVIRSPGWFATQYANQSSPTTFFDVGNPL